MQLDHKKNKHKPPPYTPHESLPLRLFPNKSSKIIKNRNQLKKKRSSYNKASSNNKTIFPIHHLHMVQFIYVFQLLLLYIWLLLLLCKGFFEIVFRWTNRNKIFWRLNDGRNWKLLRRFEVFPITTVSINEIFSLKALPRPNESRITAHASSINDHASNTRVIRKKKLCDLWFFFLQMQIVRKKMQ